MHATLNQRRAEIDLARLDAMIDSVQHSAPAQPGADQKDLLSEHLHSARAYLLGAMPEEYAAALDFARNAAGHLSDEDRRQLQETLDQLQSDISRNDAEHQTVWYHYQHHRRHARVPRGTRNSLWKFFNESDASFGVFYPKRHIVAVFPSLDGAHAAESALVKAGFGQEEVVTASGEQMLQFLQEFHDEAGVWGTLMEHLSRHFGTEEVFVDRDIRRAREGGAFLAVYCPVEAEVGRVQDLLLAFHPTAMQEYLATGIVSLI